MKSSLAKANYFQLYYDQFLPPAVGGAVNDAVQGLFAGTASPEEVAQTIEDLRGAGQAPERPSLAGRTAARRITARRGLRGRSLMRTFDGNQADHQRAARRTRDAPSTDSAGCATIVAFLLPAAAMYALFVLFPLVQASYYGLFSWNGLGPLTTTSGSTTSARPPRRGLSQGAAPQSRHPCLSLVIQLPLALGLALPGRRQMRGRAFFRTVFFLPFVLSEVVTGVVWSSSISRIPASTSCSAALPGVRATWLAWRYPDRSVRPLRRHHLEVLRIPLGALSRRAAEYPAGVWKRRRRSTAPRRLRVVRDVTIPLLGPTIRLSIFLSVLGSLQFFDLIWVMTNGGPVNASETMATYMYNFGSSASSSATARPSRW